MLFDSLVNGLRGIDHRDAIDVEVVAIGARVDRTDGDFPDAVLALGQLRGLSQPLNVTGRQPDGLGLWRKDPEGNAAIGQNLGRGHLDLGRATAAPGGRLRERRSHAGEQQNDNDGQTQSASHGASSSRV